jgi:hypothetical protein
MNPFAFLLFFGCSIALLVVRRELAMVPMLLGCTYMTLGQGIELGAISLPVFRMLLLVGILRVAIKRESIRGGLNLIDKLMITWSAWVIFAGIFHNPERAGVIYSAGGVFNIAVVYFLARTWCSNLEELMKVIKVLALLLVPIAAEMLMEKVTGKNLFSIFGGVPENSLIREGKLRAQGPFLHPILAGTVGATCFPLFIAIRERYRLQATIGLVASIVITIASASSGPVMSLLAASFALGMWRFRQYTRHALIAAVGVYIILMFTMSTPPYFLISRIDISGGSTGWHRSFLIQQTFNHFSEWWLFGTDETRHWMPNQGFAGDPHHTDVTNYYIGFGVLAGFPAMMLVLSMMGVAFAWVGKSRKLFEEVKPAHAFMIWAYGACLFSHTVTGISVAYFDQSAIFFWLSVAVISSTYSVLFIQGEVLGTAESVVVPDMEEIIDLESVTDWRMGIRNRTPVRSVEEILGPIGMISTRPKK